MCPAPQPLAELVERRRPSDLCEQNRLELEVLERDRVPLLVEDDLRRKRHPAVAFAVAIELELDNRERIVDRTRLVRRFEKADRAIGREHDALSTLVGLVMTREPNVPAELAGSAEVTLHRQILQYV